MEHFNMNTSQLDAVLAQFPNTMVRRGATSATVKGKRKSDGQLVTLLSAVSPRGRLWYVMAIEGLLSPQCTVQKLGE